MLAASPSIPWREPPMANRVSQRLRKWVLSPCSTAVPFFFFLALTLVLFLVKIPIIRVPYKVFRTHFPFKPREALFCFRFRSHSHFYFHFPPITTFYPHE